MFCCCVISYAVMGSGLAAAPLPYPPAAWRAGQRVCARAVYVCLGGVCVCMCRLIADGRLRDNLRVCPRPGPPRALYLRSLPLPCAKTAIVLAAPPVGHNVTVVSQGLVRDRAGRPSLCCPGLLRGACWRARLDSESPYAAAWCRRSIQMLCTGSQSCLPSGSVLVRERHFIFTLPPFWLRQSRESLICSRQAGPPAD